MNGPESKALPVDLVEDALLVEILEKEMAEAGLDPSLPLDGPARRDKIWRSVERSLKDSSRPESAKGTSPITRKRGWKAATASSAGLAALAAAGLFVFSPLAPRSEREEELLRGAGSGAASLRLDASSGGRTVALVRAPELPTEVAIVERKGAPGSWTLSRILARSTIGAPGSSIVDSTSGTPEYAVPLEQSPLSGDGVEVCVLRAASETQMRELLADLGALVPAIAASDCVRP